MAHVFSPELLSDRLAKFKMPIRRQLAWGQFCSLAKYSIPLSDPSACTHLIMFCMITWQLDKVTIFSYGGVTLVPTAPASFKEVLSRCSETGVSSNGPALFDGMLKCTWLPGMVGSFGQTNSKDSLWQHGIFGLLIKWLIYFSSIQ